MSADHLSLLFSGKDSDVTITCQGHTFHVHKDIICPQSAVFRAAFTGEFKVCSLSPLSALTSAAMLTYASVTGKHHSSS